MPRVPVEERRRALTAAAFRVMARVGVPAATTRLICAEAGVPQSVFHYCFRTKDELFRELTHTVTDSMLGNALDSLVEGKTFEDSVRKSLQELWRPALSQPDQQLVLYELTTALLRDTETLALAQWQYEQYFNKTRQLLEALAERANRVWTVPIEVLSRMATTMVDGLILGWLTDRNTDEVTQSIDLFAGYLATLAIPAASRKVPVKRSRQPSR